MHADRFQVFSMCRCASLVVGVSICLLVLRRIVVNHHGTSVPLLCQPSIWNMGESRTQLDDIPLVGSSCCALPFNECKES